ncbi:MAG: hypothetical protein D6762_06380 [Candidatus Neomarinimicrobiota bacterium]|nr:MAG: hypothetical protein D6762_06380 [Candidatus Neomarinimicrobiota bacterium]
MGFEDRQVSVLRAQKGLNIHPFQFNSLFQNLDSILTLLTKFTSIFTLISSKPIFSPHLPILLSLVCVISLFSGCAGTGASPDTLLEQNGAFLIRQARENWEHRDQEEAAYRALFFWKEALSIFPDRQDLNVEFAHACFFVSRYWEEDPPVRDSLFQAGARRLEDLLFPPDGISPDTAQSIRDNPSTRVRRIESVPDDQLIPLYWWSVNRIFYLIDQPVVERVEYREVLEAALHRILTGLPNYDQGGIYRLFGTFYARLPGVELERAEKYFSQAREAYPACFAAVVQQAQYLDTKAGNRDRFHEELTRIIRADPTVDPNILPENVRDQALAAKLLEQETYLFE